MGIQGDMAVEIERKFLVCNEGWRSEVSEAFEVHQAYLTKTYDLSCRVRILDGERATLTVKSAKRQLVRDEFEYEIPLEDAKRMMAICRSAAIEKTRHRLEVDGMTWDIDVFNGDNTGLVMAEIELTEPSQDFARPAWLGAEVSDDSRYKNSELSVRPYRDWREVD